MFTTEQAYTPSSLKGSNIKFQGNLSKSTLGYKIVAWTWNFGDGVICDQSACGLMATAHFYPHGKKYTVTLTLTDDHNNVAQVKGDMTP